MPSGRPQTRFLARASILLIAMLLFWWLALADMMLPVLRVAAEVCSILPGAGSIAPVSVERSGDWNFRVPVGDRPSGTGGGREPAGSLEFTIPRADMIAFTFSVPVYWAIALAARVASRGGRPLLRGTAVMAIVEILSLLVFVELTAHATAARLHPTADTFATWLRDLGRYLLMTVIPYASPFLAAISLHAELRSEMFSWSTGEGSGRGSATAG